MTRTNTLSNIGLIVFFALISITFINYLYDNTNGIVLYGILSLIVWISLMGLAGKGEQTWD